MLKSFQSGTRQRFYGVLKRILEISEPRKLTRDKLLFLASSESVERDESDPVTLMAVGKASLLMALGATDLFGSDGIDGGIVVAPHFMLSTGTGQKAADELEAYGLKVIGAEHPYPGDGSFRAGKAVLEAVRNCIGRCLFLLSGGASSLMELNHEKFPRNDVIVINEALVTSGADIKEINTIRKHISAVKGGRLAKEFSGTAMLNLIISDVTGSALDTIGSGPTYRDSSDSTFEMCLDILKRYDIFKLLSTEGRDFFLDYDKKYETQKELLNEDKIKHHILMSNEILVEKICQEFNLEFLLTLTEPGNKFLADDFTAGSLANYLLDICRRSLSAKLNVGDTIEKSRKFIIGGEPTVRVEGEGTGGRAQHVALLFLAGLIADDTLWKRRNDITLVTFATDGMDGNSPAAGAIVDRILFDQFDSSLDENGESVRAKMLGAVKKYLKKFDSYAFFKKFNSSIDTGPTGTNVLDVYLLEIA